MIGQFCLGFVFSWDYSRVALIKKRHPERQKGKLNGVGGKVNENESFKSAMQREWIEEAGIPVDRDGWKWVIEQRGNDYTLAVYSYRLSVMLPEPFKIADEQVWWYMTHAIQTRTDLVAGVKWMVPLCLDEQVTFPIKVFTP